MESYLDQAPSLASSEGGTGSESTPMTPANSSPAMLAQHYSLPLDTLTLQPVAFPSSTRAMSQLPDINDPSTATRPIQSVCCIGAGYVGRSSAVVPFLAAKWCIRPVTY